MDTNYIDNVLTSARERSASLSPLSSHQSPFLMPLAAIGLLYVGYKLFSFVRLLLSLFVLPGKPVPLRFPLPPVHDWCS